MKVLVTGGAGFIGSHMVLRLAEVGHRPVVVDNLSNGHRDAVLAGAFHEMDIRDTGRLADLMAEERIEVVIHFAAFIEAGISVREPLKFWDNNVGGSASLLEAMRRAGVDKLVFSSTAATFGNPQRVPIEEDDAKDPVNPYGDTKLAVERMLAAAHTAYGIRSVCLRYFNAAGSDPKGRVGERHTPETHLIPLALAAAAGARPELTLFGADYPTPDGTCIRDYIHVSDLAEAHLLALGHLARGGVPRAFNLGTGRGHSVREVITAVEAATGLKVPVIVGDKREGDPVSLVASPERARAELGWEPQYTSLEQMVGHAWAFLKPSLTGRQHA